MAEMENFSVSQLLENVESSIRMRNLPELNSQIDMVLHTYHDLKSAFNKLCKKRSIQTFDEDDKVSEEHLEEATKICADMFCTPLQVRTERQNISCLPIYPLSTNVSISVHLPTQTTSGDIMKELFGVSQISLF